jgi:hypothetical protein
MQLTPTSACIVRENGLDCSSRTGPYPVAPKAYRGPTSPGNQFYVPPGGLPENEDESDG